jgi:hypothetical protein
MARNMPAKKSSGSLSGEALRWSPGGTTIQRSLGLDGNLAVQDGDGVDEER